MLTLLHSVPPTLQQAATNPCLHQRLLDTHGQLLVSLWWGHCSLFLGPGTNKVLFVPSKSLFPHSCVSSGSSVVGLMATSSKRTDAIPRSTAPVTPAAVYCWPVPMQETLKHSSVSVSVGSLVLVCTRFVWALWVSLASIQFDSICDFAPPTVLLGLLLCPWMWDKSQNYKTLRKNWGRYFYLCLDSRFLDMTLESWWTKEKILSCIKNKSFVHQIAIQKVKRQLTWWEKMFANPISLEV